MREGRSYGTAFVVEFEGAGPGRPPYAALTCEHVVRQAGLVRGDDKWLTLASLVEGRPTFEASVSWGDVHEGADLALLYFDPTQVDFKRWPLKPLLLSDNRQATGHDFHTYGFPLREKRAERGVAYEADDEGLLHEVPGYGQAVALAGSGDRQRMHFQHCTMVTRGYSGAPAFDLITQRVVAVLDQVWRPDDLGRGVSHATGVPASVVRAKLPELRCRRERPYRGLDHFTEADERYWVDPSGLMARVLERLDAGHRFVAIVGPSGVGKSSLLSAGLLPQLRDRAKEWDAEVVYERLDRARALEMASACQGYFEKPSPERPDFGGAKQALYDLLRGWAARAKSAPAAAAIAPSDAAARGNLVVLFDQFEELLLIDQAPCSRVVKTLLLSIQEGWGGDASAHPAVRLIVVLRESFLGRLGERAPELRQSLEAAKESVPLIIDDAKLREIIEEPAIVVGRPWGDPAFVAAVLSAVKGDFATETGRGVRVAALPILQVFLARAWDAREGDLEKVAAPRGRARARLEAPVMHEARWANVHDEFRHALAQMVDEAVARLTRRRRAESAPPADLSLRKETEGLVAPNDASLHKKMEELVAQLLARFLSSGVGEGSGAPKGRARRLRELEASLSRLTLPATLEVVVRELVQARVLTARAAEGEGVMRRPSVELSLELVHDAILNGWPQLRKPLERERAFLAWQAVLTERARLMRQGARVGTVGTPLLWHDALRPLLSGFELETARVWRRERASDLAPAVRTLINESERQDRVRRRLARGAAWVMALLVVGILFVTARGVLEGRQRDRERLAAAHRYAVEQRLSRAVSTKHEVRVLGQEPGALADAIRAAECVERIEDPGARSAIASALLRSLLAFALRAPFDAAPDVPYRVALTEDGREAVFQWLDDSGKYERFELWDARTGAKLRPLARREHCEASIEGPGALKWQCGLGLFGGPTPYAGTPEVALERAVGGSFKPEGRALLRSSPKELWLAREAGKGVDRIRLTDGTSAGELAPGRTATALDRSADGSALAVGTEEGALLLWDAKSERTTSLPHPGPVLYAAVAAGGSSAITLGPARSCRYVAGREPRCARLEGPFDGGAVGMDDTGALAAVSTFSMPPVKITTSAEAPSRVRGTLLVTVGGREFRYPKAPSIVDLDVSIHESTPNEILDPLHWPQGQAAEKRASLTGVSYGEPFLSGQISLGFDIAEPSRQARQPDLIDRPLVSDVLEFVQLSEDGAWTYRSAYRSPGDVVRKCAEGTFRRLASCEGTLVLARGNQWLRLSEGPRGASPPQPDRRVLAYSPERRVILVDGDGSLEVRRVDANGVGDPASKIVCRRREPLKPTHDDPVRAFAAACDRAGELVVLRDTDAGVALQTLSAQPPGSPDGIFLDARRDDDEIVVWGADGQLWRADLSAAGLVWGPDEAQKASVKAFGGGFLVLQALESAVWALPGASVSILQPKGADVYAGRRRVLHLDEHQAHMMTSKILNTSIGPLLWLKNTIDNVSVFFDSSGDEVAVLAPPTSVLRVTPGPLPPGGIAFEGAPASDVTSSPDGRWLLVERDVLPFSPYERAPALLRVDGASKPLVFDSLLPVPDSNVLLPDVGYKSFWLPAAPSGAPRVLIARGAKTWVAERKEAGAWALTRLADLPTGARGEPRSVVPSPGGSYVALVFHRDLDWVPAHGVELREAQSLNVLGTIATGSAAPPWFVDEEHLLLSEPMEVVSFRPDELRREACDLLRSRSEFRDVKNVCERAPSDCDAEVP
jgi:Trypsin-like peptidase domain